MAEPASLTAGSEAESDAIDVIAYSPGGRPPVKPRRVTAPRILMFVLLLISTVALWLK